MPDSKVEASKLLLFAFYQNKELSTYKISRLLGRSQGFIYTSLRRYGIPTISNSERYKGKPGRPHTKESRRKLSLAKLGDKNPMKRLEVRMKVSKANKGRKFSKEIREKFSRAQRGRTIKWGAAISIAKKKWYTSKQGKEFLQKLRQRRGSNNPMFGKSAEIKERHWTKLLSQQKKEGIIRKFRENRMRQKFPSKATKIEKLMENELKKRKIVFAAHKTILKICQPDITIPSHKLVVQCDGDWWHANPSFYAYKPLSKIQKNNINRDRYQDDKLRKNGWYVMRFWESDIKNNVSRCADRIEKFLNRKRGNG